MNPVRAVAALTLVLSASACIMPDQLAQYQKDIADVQQSVAAVTKVQSDLAKRVDALESKAAGGETVKRSELADLRSRQDEIVREATATADRLDQVNARVDRLSQDVQAAREASRRTATPTATPPPGGADAATAPAVAAGSSPNPNALYTSAYADFSKGNYALAIQGFEEYAQRFSDSELADNAMYWVGECKFSQGSYKPAIDAFDRLLEKYPKSDKAAAANLKKALAFVQQNELGQAIEQLRYVTATYPGTDEARIASDRLQTLGKP